MFLLLITCYGIFFVFLHFVELILLMGGSMNMHEQIFTCIGHLSTIFIKHFNMKLDSSILRVFNVIHNSYLQMSK